jgi:hypothetical protein
MWPAGGLTHYSWTERNIDIKGKIYLFVSVWFLVYRLSSVGIATRSLREEHSGDRIPVGTRFFTPVHSDPVTHPAFYGRAPDLSSGNHVAGA